MKNKSLFFLLLISLFFFKEEVTAKTIHAILVADTITEIRSVTQPDLQHVQDELRTIAKHTQSVLKEKVFAFSNFEKGKLISYLSHLNVDSSDMVFFYFSGHGYRTRDQVSPFPVLNFEFYKPGIDLKWIADIIRSKNPQFALVMADCCNNYIDRGFVNAEDKNIRMTMHFKEPYYPGYSHLFCDAKGCVVVSSSSEGEFSYGSRYGGLFTQCFFVSLNHEISEKIPSWKHLLEQASSYIKNVQKPICQVYH